MPAFCLVKPKAQEFIRKIKNKELDVNELAAMTSFARRQKFQEALGLDVESAKEVNALFESKLLLKYQKTGLKNWIEKLANLKPETKTDLISRVNRMEKILNPAEEEKFLADLVEKRLDIGEEVSQETAKEIFELSQKVEETKAKVTEDMPAGSQERLEYGAALVKFQDYVRELKVAANKMTAKDYLMKPQEILYEVGGAFKSALSTLDNSFFGRQGIKTLFTNPKQWGSAFLKSWTDIGKELKGQSAMLPLKADIFSRPNAMNGRYQKMKLDIGIDGEEAFPSSLPEKIPLLGRIFKGAQSAFNGAALRMRADVADKVLKMAERNGIDIDNKEQLEGIGTVINSLTGRGNLGVLEQAGKQINILMFSAKFLKANFDTLTAHLFDPKATPFAKKVAAQNLFKIITSIAAILGTAYALNPDSVELDPRNSKFGKLLIGKRTIDVTGGMGSLINLAARIVPTMHNGEWGFWRQDAKGKYIKTNVKKFGQETALDAFENFFEGKLSPIAGLVRDIWKGYDYDYNEVTARSAAENLITPLPVQKFEQLMETEEGTQLILYMMLDGLGFGVN